MNTIRVALVDDHRVVLRSLENFLAAHDGFLVVGTAYSGEDALRGLAEWHADVVVLDLCMPGGLDGVDTARRLKRHSPPPAIVVLTASAGEERVTAALRAGADGYVLKNSEPRVLLDAIRAVSTGRSYVDPSVPRDVLATRTDEDALTPRETDVLLALANGAPNKDIAASLGITEETVKTHVSSVLGKLHVDNRAQAIVTAIKRGLIPLPD